MEEVSLMPREVREAGFSIARLLSGQEQETYKQVVEQYGEKARKSLEVDSNIWKILLLNQEGVRTVTFPELEDALENGLDLRGHYEDAREIVLRSAGDSYTSNDYLAKDLTRQLEIRKFKSPLIVRGLRIEEDDNSDYGLRFETTNKTKVFEAPDLNHENNQRRFSRINPDYSIDFEDKGQRTLYTRDKGLSGLYLNDGLDLVSYDENLAYSFSSGRVVVVTGEASSQKNLDEYLTKLQEQRETEIAEIDNRYKQAEALLRGK